MCRPTRQGNTAQDKTTQENARPGKTRHFQDKTNTTQGKTQDKTTAFKAYPFQRHYLPLRLND